VIGGDILNTIASNAEASTIAGGVSNSIIGNYGTIGGGTRNAITANHSTIAGGTANNASASYATVGGGQANGASAVNATVSGGIANYASNVAATVSGGYNNLASGPYATVAGGEGNLASGDRATILGGSSAEATQFGQSARASGSFAVRGDAQISTYILRGTTTANDPSILALDGGTTRLVVPFNRTMQFIVQIAGRSSTGVSAAYFIRGAVENSAGTTTIVGSVNRGDFEDDIFWNATVTVNDTASTDTLDITVDPAFLAAGVITRWVARVETVEVLSP
jgi:hypothetical protein